MESEAKQRSHQRNRRRQRAARMQRQKAEGRADLQGSGEDESPARHKQRPPTRKKRIKMGVKDQALFEEDIIDGFAILSFRTYEELENTMKSFEKRTPSSPVELVLDAKLDKMTTNHKQRHKQTPNLLNNNNNDEEAEEAEVGGDGVGGPTSDSENCKVPITIQEVNGPSLLHHNNSTRYRLSDVSSHSSSGRGYMCDSESNDDRGSDTDLFRTSSIKREANETPTNGRSSPLLLPSLVPIQNGPTESPVPTTTTTVTTTSVLTTKSPSPPLFSPPLPPFVAEVASVVKAPSPSHNHNHNHHHNHHSSHPLLQQQPPQLPQFGSTGSSSSPTLFSPISPRPQLRASSSPPLLLSTSPSIPPKASVCSTTSVITQTRPSPGVGASPATTPSRDSHSNSSSSISSLSQLSQSLHLPRDTSRSSSRNNTPSCCGLPPTSLVFSKPSWASPGIVNGPHLTPPPTSASLAISLHNHTGHFGPSTAAPPAPSLHSSGIFPPPIALSSPSLSLANPGPASFTDPIFTQPNQQDLLRRELDTRFLASLDRSINIPPPPYMRAEMHPHMHQHSPFLGLGNSMVPQPNPHMYDKFPKLEPPSFYSRNTLGLPGYPGLTPLLGTAGTAPGPAPPTPFTPAGQLAAFQPKKHPNLMARSRLDPALPENMSNLVKSKNLKSGRWCAMHVRIAWEIYHHQQKQQQQAEVHKGKNPSDLLRPGHLFSAGLPRPHDLPPISSSLLAATAASGHGRSFEAAAQHHNSFLNPSPAHLGVSHFARPNYPGFGGPGSSFAAGLSTLGLAGPGLFANRELSAAAANCLSGLSGAQDPLYRLHRTATFGPPPVVPPPPPPVASGAGGASWGGLKAEADRERMHREQQEQEQKRREKEQQLDRERREQERQKERDRENRVFHHHHHHHIPENLRNGDPMMDPPPPPPPPPQPQRTSQHHHHHHHHHQQHSRGEWGSSSRSNERTREASRSPLRKSDSAFESSKPPSRPPEVKVKEEKKDEDTTTTSNNNHVLNHHERTTMPNDFLARTLGTHRGVLNSLPSAAERLPPPHGFWSGLPPGASEHFRNLEFHQAARDQMLHRYGPLVPVGAHERFREAEYARHESFAAAFDRSKLPPPPLRPNDPYPGTGLGPPGAIFPPLLPGLGSSRAAKGASPSTAIPPPLIPCTGALQNHQGASHKMGLSENPHEPYFARERQELALHPTELDAQSR